MRKSQNILTENLKQTWNKKFKYIWPKFQTLTIVRSSCKIPNTEKTANIGKKK